MYLLTIVARVIAATKCKLGGNRFWKMSSPLAPLPQRAARVIQRIHMMFQGNCVLFRGFSDKAESRSSALGGDQPVVGQPAQIGAVLKS
jgi:hypothetical protein